MAHQLVRRIAVRGIRYVGRAVTGERFYLVPATVRMPCLAPEPGRLTPTQRKRLRAIERQVRVRTHRYGLALVPLGPAQTGGTAYSAGSLRTDVDGNHLIAIFNAADNRSATLAGVVPDGIDAVRLTYDSHTTTMRIAPQTNFWSTRVPGPAPDFNARILWMDHGGHVIRRFSGIDETPY